MIVFEILGLLLCACGLVFFLAGTVGLLRFPDLFTRLHALTKADTMGLMLIGAGTAIVMADAVVALKILLICLLVMASGATGATLIARHARGRGNPGQ